MESPAKAHQFVPWTFFKYKILLKFDGLTNERIRVPVKERNYASFSQKFSPNKNVFLLGYTYCCCFLRINAQITFIGNYMRRNTRNFWLLRWVRIREEQGNVFRLNSCDVSVMSRLYWLRKSDLLGGKLGRCS